MCQHLHWLGIWFWSIYSVREVLHVGSVAQRGWAAGAAAAHGRWTSEGQRVGDCFVSSLIGIARPRSRATSAIDQSRGVRHQVIIESWWFELNESRPNRMKKYHHHDDESGSRICRTVTVFVFELEWLIWDWMIVLRLNDWFEIEWFIWCLILIWSPGSPWRSGPLSLTRSPDELINRALLEHEDSKWVPSPSPSLGTDAHCVCNTK